VNTDKTKKEWPQMNGMNADKNQAGLDTRRVWLLAKRRWSGGLSSFSLKLYDDGARGSARNPGKPVKTINLIFLLGL